MGNRTLAEQVAELEAERDDYKRRCEKFREDLENGAIVEAPLIPRAITGEEMREGQWVAIRFDKGEWFSGEVRSLLADYFVVSDGEQATSPMRRDSATIVLLADAPEPEKPQPVTAEDIRQSEPGSTWEGVRPIYYEWDGKHLREHHAIEGLMSYVIDMEQLLEHAPLTRSTAAPRGTYPKRLTVEDLDAAEVGSVLKLSTNTVKTHLRSIYRKLSAHTRDQAIRAARDRGLIKED